MVILIVWMLWKERNNRNFDRRVRSVSEALGWIIDEICAWFMAGYHRLETVMLALGRSSGRELIAM